MSDPKSTDTKEISAIMAELNEEVTFFERRTFLSMKTLGILLLGGVLVGIILPMVIPELEELGKQGWVVYSIGAVFIYGVMNLYEHRGAISLEETLDKDATLTNIRINHGFHSLYLDGSFVDQQRAVTARHESKQANHQRVYEMAIEVMPMLGFFGTVIGLLAFLPTWVAGQPDIDGVTYAFLTSAAGLVLSALLRFADGITEVK